MLFLPSCGLRQVARLSSPRLQSLHFYPTPAAAPQPIVPLDWRSQAAQPASPGRSLQQASAALLLRRENKRSKCPSLLKKTLVKGNQEAENSQSIRGSFTRFRFGGQEERGWGKPTTHLATTSGIQGRTKNRSLPRKVSCFTAPSQKGKKKKLT